MKDYLNRPSWDSVFLAMSFVLSQRSLDPSTKHGCFICSDDHSILSAGFNSPPANSVDQNIPNTRPEKYWYYEHSEKNAIYNAAKNGIGIKGATYYITGEPCVDCFRGIIQSGASNIIYGPIQSKCIDEQSRNAKKEMLIGEKRPNYIEYKNDDFVDVLVDTLKYIQDKTGIDVKSKIDGVFDEPKE